MVRSSSVCHSMYLLHLFCPANSTMPQSRFSYASFHESGHIYNKRRFVLRGSCDSCDNFGCPRIHLLSHFCNILNSRPLQRAVCDLKTQPKCCSSVFAFHKLLQLSTYSLTTDATRAFFSEVLHGYQLPRLLGGLGYNYWLGPHQQLAWSRVKSRCCPRVASIQCRSWNYCSRMLLLRLQPLVQHPKPDDNDSGVVCRILNLDTACWPHSMISQT